MGIRQDSNIIMLNPDVILSINLIYQDVDILYTIFFYPCVSYGCIVLDSLFVICGCIFVLKNRLSFLYVHCRVILRSFMNLRCFLNIFKRREIQQMRDMVGSLLLLYQMARRKAMLSFQSMKMLMFQLRTLKMERFCQLDMLDGILRYVYKF